MLQIAPSSGQYLSIKSRPKGSENNFARKNKFYNLFENKFYLFKNSKFFRVRLLVKI